MEKASFEDMRSKGLVQRDSSFAGHSLGEYSALAALAEVMPIESLVSVVYYRGLTMQVAVERDEWTIQLFHVCRQPVPNLEDFQRASIAIRG